MHLADAFRTATNGIRNAKLRSGLTMLGIVIGIAAVVLLMSIGSSAQQVILSQVQGIGSNLIFIIPGATKGSSFSPPASVQGVVIKTLVKQDVDSLKAEPSIQRVAPEVRGQARVVFENTDVSVLFEGATPDFFEVRNLKIGQGVMLTESDVESFNHVAVIGSALAKTLFDQRTPVNQMIRLKDISFRVIGVLDKKGVGPFGVDQDNLVVVPMTVAQNQMLGKTYYDDISVEGKPDYNIDFVSSRITSILRQNHHVTDPDKDDFTIRTQADALSLLGNITSIMTVFLTAIGAISLIVGGIGIMNIMLVSVIERTREIGLRKAVGASNNDILQQFLLESVVLTFLGGIGGLVVATFLTVVAYLILSQVLSTGWSFSMPLSAIILALGVSTTTGVVFGIYPARKAAMKNPIEALRYE